MTQHPHRHPRTGPQRSVVRGLHNACYRAPRPLPVFFCPAERSGYSLSARRTRYTKPNLPYCPKSKPERKFSASRPLANSSQGAGGATKSSADCASAPLRAAPKRATHRDVARDWRQAMHAEASKVSDRRRSLSISRTGWDLHCNAHDLERVRSELESLEQRRAHLEARWETLTASPANTNEQLELPGLEVSRG